MNVSLMYMYMYMYIHACVHAECFPPTSVTFSKRAKSYGSNLLLPQLSLRRRRPPNRRRHLHTRSQGETTVTKRGVASPRTCVPPSTRNTRGERVVPLEAASHLRRSKSAAAVSKRRTHQPVATSLRQHP